MERSLSRLKPTNEVGHGNEIGPGLATRGKSKKGIGCKKKEVKPHASGMPRYSDSREENRRITVCLVSCTDDLHVATKWR